MFKKFPIDRSTGGRALEKVRAWSKQTRIYRKGKGVYLKIFFRIICYEMFLISI